MLRWKTFRAEFPQLMSLLEEGQNVRIAIFVTNVSNTYGGGRLAAFLLAQCLARAGADVCFVTNAKPVFYDELKNFAAPCSIQLYLTKDFVVGMPSGMFDIGIVVPGQSQDRQFYIGARGFVIQRGAKLVLFNFETPNWFNAFSPTARDEGAWIEWRRCVEDGCLILSNSKESMRFAQRYYCSHSRTTFFDYWHQPINITALNKVAPQYRDKRVVCFVRAQDPHKGAQDLMDVLSDDLRGWTLSLIVGSPKLDDDYRESIQAVAARHGIRIEIKPLISDIGKFIELKRARMLLYPSLFEGYGIPPIEALSAGTPCVCYDLPVFREVCGDALVTAPLGDIDALRLRVREVIRSSPKDWEHLPDRVRLVSNIQLCGEAALTSLHRYLEFSAAPPMERMLPSKLMRPSQPLVNISRLRLDAAEFVEIEGWTPLSARSEIFAYVNGQLIGSATYGLTRKDVLENNPWVGTSQSGFSIVGPFKSEDETLEVTAYACGPDGTVFDTVRRVFNRSSVQAAAKKMDPKDYQRGGIKIQKSGFGSIISGWVATRAPRLNLEIIAGGRKLWCQGGRSRPDVMAKLTNFPAQAPAFAAYLNVQETIAAEEIGYFVLLLTTSGGVTVEKIPFMGEALIEGQPENPGAEGECDKVNSLPVLMQLRSATYDEYGVAEFEGWVLSQPRPTLLRFFLGGTVLGEGIPDRLNLNIFDKNRAYGDAFCGFQFAGRVAGLSADEARYRVEVHGEDAVIHVVEGVPQLTRRADAVLGADAADLPPGLLDQDGPPSIAFIVDDPAALDVLEGAALRAFMAHLRRIGYTLVLVLHGNPHLFATDLVRWRRLCDGFLLVNALTPGLNSRDPSADNGTAALTNVVGKLAEQCPCLRAVVAWGEGLRSSLSSLPPGGDVVALVLSRSHSDDGCKRLSEQHVASFGVRRTTDKSLLIGYDQSGLAAEIPAVAGDWFKGVPIVALDCTSMAPELLTRAVAVASERVRAAGYELGIVVDAPPLENEATLRVRFGLRDAVTLLWPMSIAAASTSQIRLLLDVGFGSHPGPLAAAALDRNIPVVLWAEMASNDAMRPWPKLSLDECLQKETPADAAFVLEPYAEVDALFSRSAIALPVQKAAE